jgi:nickel-dependent lactate racemase
MRVELAGATRHLEFDVPAENVLPLHRTDPAPALADPAEAVRAALEHPHDYPALRRALTPDDHVTILVDETVPQLPRLLVPILDHLRDAHIEPEAVTLLCLPPSSGQPWLEELPDEYQDVRVEVHQPADRRSLAYLATTKQGRRIYLNRSAVDADQLVVLTRRTFDPLLGYAGGEMAIYPGLSDEATRDEMRPRLHAEAPTHKRWPVSREAKEVAWLMGAPFLVQVIEGSDGDVAHVVGGPVESTEEGQRLLDARWRVEVDRYADVAVASMTGDPRRHGADDFARAFFAASRVVRPGGTVVLLTEAAPELGPALRMLRDNDEPAAALTDLFAEKPADLATGFMWSSAAGHAHLYLLSGLADDVVEELFATPLEDAAQVQRLLARDAMCVFLPDAHKTLASVRS